MKSNAKVVNILEIVREKLEFDVKQGDIIINHCVIEDHNTGKKYIFGSDTMVSTETGYYYKAYECVSDCFGKFTKYAEPFNVVCVAPIFNYGNFLGYVFGVNTVVIGYAVKKAC